VLWGFASLVAATVVLFFLWGLADGTVSSFNMMLWLVMLGGVGTVVFGSLELRRAGRVAAAVQLLLILAIPGIAYAVFLLAAVILQPRWN
jgi:hypothetical protein